MCGIAGIFAYRYGSPEPDRDEMRRIRDHMEARGPDGAGEWFSEDGSVVLGHRRLSIIDLSDRGAQPMVSQDGKLVISFNGEIYNYKVLRKDLERKGHSFLSDSDTEVLLHLYAEKGEAMVHDIRGMFAFALWDTDKHSLLLVRDPYGIKPLYYSDDGYTLRLASQVRAIIAGGRVSRGLEPGGVVGFYLFGSVPEPYTIYHEIRAVPAGSYVWVNSTGPTLPKQYFSIAQVWVDAEADDTCLNNPQERVREALLDSIQHHMVADVPVGAFLSAGVDSGTLVGLMSDALYEKKFSPRGDSRQRRGNYNNNSIQTITLAFEEFKNKHVNEAPLAEKIANRYATRHTERVVTQTEFHEDLPKILETMDQPSIDGINTWFVSKAAKELDLKVAISGLGGDELFGGYPSFRDIPRWVGLFGIPSKIPLLGDVFRFGYQAMQVFFHSLAPNYSVFSPKAAGVLKYGGTYPGAYMLRRGLFMPWELDKFMDRELLFEGLRRLHPLNHIGSAMQPCPSTAFGKVAALESSLYMRNQLLRDADWAGMAHSLEIRLPLVDAWLLRAVAPVLVSFQALNGKRLLGESPMQSLPEEVMSRSKTGFTTPIGEWITRREMGRQKSSQRLPQKNVSYWSREWAEAVMTQAKHSRHASQI